MKRSVQEIIELLVFGLIAVLIGTGLLWVVGWVIGGLGGLFKLLAGLIWSLLRFVVPIAVVGAAVYALVRLLQGQREPTTVKPTSTASSGTGTTGAGATGAGTTGTTASTPGATGTGPSTTGVSGTSSSGVGTSGAGSSSTAAPSPTTPSASPPATTTSPLGTESASQDKPADEERTGTLRNEIDSSKPGQDVRRPMGAAHGEAGDAGSWKSEEHERDGHEDDRHHDDKRRDEHVGQGRGEDEHESDDDEDRR